MGSLTPLVLLLSVFFTSDVILARRHLGSNAGGENYIVGGTEADIKDYTYMAYLTLSDGTDNFECGGSIISRRYVLSAAHCFSNIISVIVRIGSTDKFSGGYTYMSETFYTHPKYNSSTFDYDAALVYIAEGMKLDGSNSSRVRLIRSGRKIPGGTIVNVTGWGVEQEGGNPSPRLLRVVQVPTLTNANCSTKVNGVTPRTLCAGLEEGGKDSCQCDSGGPAVSNKKQIGIVSFGFGCARPDQPGVYTNVTNYEIRNWIRRRSRV